jgi:hypothetical protein
MDFHVDELEAWKEETDPVYAKAKRLAQVREDLIKDDWAIHWWIDQGQK